jgi:hypothetical protein
MGMSFENSGALGLGILQLQDRLGFLSQYIYPSCTGSVQGELQQVMIRQPGP